jgi:hypothetical protein
MCADGLNEVVQALDQRGDTAGGRHRARHTGAGRIGVSSEDVFRALRDLPGNHGRAQGPFGPIGGRLHGGSGQKAHQVAPIMGSPQRMAQALLIGGCQPARAQGGGELGPHYIPAGGAGRNGPRGPGMPPGERVLPQRFASLPAVAGPPFLLRPPLAARPQDRGQTFKFIPIYDMMCRP